MSALFTRLSERLESGHARGPIDAHVDGRVARISEFRPAAVLLAVTERENPGLLLIHRPSNMRAHPGQVAFPGGKIDPGENPVEAALREANEELGIAPADVRIIGESDIYCTGSGFEITPVIGVIPPDIQLNPNPAEVAQWFEIPFDFALDPANHIQFTHERDGETFPLWQITWGDHRIWGVTAGVLVNMARRLLWHG